MSGLSSGERRSFYIRLAERTMARGDPTRHVTVHMIGVLRPPANKKDQKANKKKGMLPHNSIIMHFSSHFFVVIHQL